jgi:hypothetical protein
MMGSRHPKTHCAASQERSLECLQTLEKLEGCRQSLRNIQQIWRRNGLFPATPGSRGHDVLCGCGAAVDFDFSATRGLRRIRISIIVSPRCGWTSRAQALAPHLDEI